MPTTTYFSSWWSGTNTGDSNEEVQTPPSSVNRRPPTRSQSSRHTKKRKIDDSNDIVLANGDGDQSTSLEQIAASLRKAEARAQRVESLLKRVLANQKKILAEDGNNEEEGDGEIDEGVEEESNEENKEVATTPSGRRVSIGRRPWTEKEYQLVAMGIAIHGRDSAALVKVLANRNRNQISGFLKRNWNGLIRDSKQFTVRNESDKSALLAAIKNLLEADSEEEEDDSEEKDNEDNEVIQLNKGSWADEERERLLRGIAAHGKSDIKVLATIVQTRTPRQTREYINRHLERL
jgi:hypothetical protein